MDYEGLERLVMDEIRQREEEGYDISEVRSALAEIKGKDSLKLKSDNGEPLETQGET